MPRLLEAGPLEGTVDARVEVHLQVGRQSWLHALWTLRSFYHAARCSYRLCLHDDGSLDDEAAGALAYQCPHARLLLRQAADAEAAVALANYPALLALRSTGSHTRFLADVTWANAGKSVLLLSPGVLFLDAPAALMARAEDTRYPSAVALDYRSRYVLDADDAERELGVRPLPLMHSAVAIVRPSALEAHRTDTFAGHPNLRSGRPAEIMRTLLALMLSSDGAELLPGEYAVRRDRETALGAAACYDFPPGRLYYREGLTALLAGNFRASLSF
ncbi:MAG: hypothetical protein AAF458_22560 [Pseudomonadota bacterium]